MTRRFSRIFFFFNDTATTEIYTLSLHDALPILSRHAMRRPQRGQVEGGWKRERCFLSRSEEHTSELQSQSNLVCRLLLEKKKHGRCPTPRRQEQSVFGIHAGPPVRGPRWGPERH